jgi:hypothetical protein
LTIADVAAAVAEPSIKKVTVPVGAATFVPGLGVTRAEKVTSRLTAGSDGEAFKLIAVDAVFTVRVPGTNITL